MTRLDLLILGDANPDLVISGDDVHPRFGQVEIIADEANLVVGGSASITAVGAARLGMKVGVCSVVGKDSFGRYMIEQLDSAGVDTSTVHIDINEATGLTVVLVEANDRAMITAPGTISGLSASHLDALPGAPADHVHVSSYYLMSESFREVLPRHLRRFREHGCTTSIDTNWDPSLTWQLADVLDQIDVFFPNEAEFLAITGGESIADAFDRFDRGETTVAVKAGGDGAFALVDSSLVRHPAPKLDKFVDAIGAGDSFNAGFMAARHNGLSVQDALAVAVASGSLSTRGTGGTEMQPDWDEALECVGFPS